MLIFNLVVLLTADEFDVGAFAIILILSGIFAGLGFMTKKQPFAAIVIGLVIYVGLWIFDVIVSGPEQLFRGIIVKGIIVYFLVTGLKHAREAERIRRDLERRG